MVKKIAFVCVVMLAALIAACSSSETAACGSDSECFAGEICRAGACAIGEREPDAGDTDAASDVSDGESGTDTDEDTASEDASDTSVEDAEDTATVDAADTSDEMDAQDGEDAADAVDVPICLVDKFTGTCDNDEYEPNNEFLDANLFLGTTNFGCVNDEFRTIDERFSATLCHNELADYYKFYYTKCDAQSFRIEIEFRPQIECPSEYFKFDDRHGYDCSDDNIRCEDLPNGGQRLILTVEPGLTAANPMTFSVEPVQPAEFPSYAPQFPYTIDVKLTR